MRNHPWRIAAACLVAIVAGMFLSSPAHATKAHHTKYINEINTWGYHHCGITGQSGSTTLNWCNWSGDLRPINHNGLNGKTLTVCNALMHGAHHERLLVRCSARIVDLHSGLHANLAATHCDLLSGTGNKKDNIHAGKVIVRGPDQADLPDNEGRVRWSGPTFKANLYEYPDLTDRPALKCFMKWYLSFPDLSGGTYLQKIFLPWIQKVSGNVGPTDSYSYWKFVGANRVPGLGGGPDLQTHVTESYPDVDGPVGIGKESD